MVMPIDAEGRHLAACLFGSESCGLPFSASDLAVHQFCELMSQSIQQNAGVQVVSISGFDRKNVLRGFRSFALAVFLDTVRNNCCTVRGVDGALYRPPPDPR